MSMKETEAGLQRRIYTHALLARAMCPALPFPELSKS